MLWAILNKSWRQHSTKQQLYCHLPPIMKTSQVRQTRHVRHCWRSRDKFVRDILLWTPSNGWAKAGQPARTYIQELCADTRCSLEDQPGMMDNRNRWWERVREIQADDVYIYIYIYRWAPICKDMQAFENICVYIHTYATLWKFIYIYIYIYRCPLIYMGMQAFENDLNYIYIYIYPKVFSSYRNISLINTKVYLNKSFSCWLMCHCHSTIYIRGFTYDLNYHKWQWILVLHLTDNKFIQDPAIH